MQKFPCYMLDQAINWPLKPVLAAMGGNFPERQFSGRQFSGETFSRGNFPGGMASFLRYLTWIKVNDLRGLFGQTAEINLR